MAELLKSLRAGEGQRLVAAEGGAADLSAAAVVAALAATCVDADPQPAEQTRRGRWGGGARASRAEAAGTVAAGATPAKRRSSRTSGACASSDAGAQKKRHVQR